MAPSTTNGLSTTLQGWRATTILNGQRTFTPSGGSASTVAITGFAAANSVQSNDNLIFPDSVGYSVFDNAGLALTLASPAPLADGTTTSSVSIKGSSGQYYEQGTGAAQTTSVSYISFQTYMPGTSLPPCQAVSTTYQWCWQVTSAYFTSYIAGTMTINPLPGGTSSVPTWAILSVNGTRTYTDLTTGTTTVSVITSLLPVNSIGGNDNLLYLGQTPLLDGNGISVSFDNIPPVYGENIPGQTNTMNLWWNGPTFLEENEGNRHEVNATYSSLTITPSSSGLYPTCPSSPNTNAARALSAPSIAALVLALLACMLLL